MEHVVETIKRMLEAIPAIWDVAALVLGLLLAVRGAVKVFSEVPDFLKDWWDQFRHRPFRVRTTTMKVIISESQTQVVKLRTIRTHERRDKLDLDPVPVYGPGLRTEDQEAPLNASQYSLPGRSAVVPWEKRKRFEISFLPDEELEPHRDHSVVLSFIMEAKIDVLYKDVFFEAVQPLGSERFVMEIYFAPGWKLKERAGKAGQVFPVDHKGNKKQELLEPRACVKYYRDVDFHDGRGDIDFIRAIINKPPQDDNIRVEWDWEKQKHS
jgi:hypothetical protein